MAVEIAGGLNKAFCSGENGHQKLHLLSPAISSGGRVAFSISPMEHLDDFASHYHPLQLTLGGPVSSRFRQRQRQAAAPSSPCG